MACEADSLAVSRAKWLPQAVICTTIAHNGPERVPTAAKVPNIQHWQPRMMLKETASGLKQLHTSLQAANPCAAFPGGLLHSLQTMHTGRHC